MLHDVLVVPSVRRQRLDGGTMATRATPPGPVSTPIDFPPGAARSAWTMPSFYLVPFMCAYLFGAMRIIRVTSFLCRKASRP